MDAVELLELAEEIAFGNLKKIRPDIALYSYSATVGGDPRRQHVSEALRSDSSTSDRQRQPPHNGRSPVVPDNHGFVAIEVSNKAENGKLESEITVAVVQSSLIAI